MNIQRDIVGQLLKWKEMAHRQPLIVQGARQIGKTWVITHFGQQYFNYLAVFNFDRQYELRSLFATTKEVGRLLQELAFHTDVPIIPGQTLLFFDEIQECGDALNALKYFAEDAPEYHIIAAGSLLGVALSHGVAGFPVGKVHFVQMYPVTFKEYLRAADLTLFQHCEHVAHTHEPLPEVVFNQLSLYYREYHVAGGMPRAASALLDGLGAGAVEDVLNDILLSFANDFSKYVDNKDVPRIREIWRSIPSQLSRENKKFVFRTVRSGARAREYESALDWLSLSGMIHKIYVCETPAVPLQFYEDTSAFKVYMVDIALLRCLARLPREMIVSQGELLKEFKGAMAENFVLNALLAQGCELPHYWTLQGNRAEVDFLIPHGLEIIPVEVKSDERISGKSFAVYNEKYHPSLRVRFSLKNVKHDGNLLNLPIFLADWLTEWLG